MFVFVVYYDVSIGVCFILDAVVFVLFVDCCLLCVDVGCVMCFD